MKIYCSLLFLFITSIAFGQVTQVEFEQYKESYFEKQKDAYQAWLEQTGFDALVKVYSIEYNENSKKVQLNLLFVDEEPKQYGSTVTKFEENTQKDFEYELVSKMKQLFELKSEELELRIQNYFGTRFIEKYYIILSFKQGSLHKDKNMPRSVDRFIQLERPLGSSSTHTLNMTTNIFEQVEKFLRTEYKKEEEDPDFYVVPKNNTLHNNSSRDLEIEIKKEVNDTLDICDTLKKFFDCNAVKREKYTYEIHYNPISNEMHWQLHGQYRNEINRFKGWLYDIDSDLEGEKLLQHKLDAQLERFKKWLEPHSNNR